VLARDILPSTGINSGGLSSFSKFLVTALGFNRVTPECVIANILANRPNRANRRSPLQIIPTKQKIQKKFGTFPPDQSKNPVPNSGNPSLNLEHRQKNWKPVTKYVLLPTNYILLPTKYVLSSTNNILLPTKHVLLPTNYI